VDKVSAAGTSVAAQAAQATNAVSNAASSRRPDNWDLQQVGQVLDWVGDLLPGDGKETKERKMADAVREKEKADYKRDQEAREEAGMKQEERDERKLQADRKKREKFDLARFYGGLMLKLRDDGL
jgi:triacylglycerol lipase